MLIHRRGMFWLALIIAVMIAVVLCNWPSPGTGPVPVTVLTSPQTMVNTTPGKVKHGRLAKPGNLRESRLELAAKMHNAADVYKLMFTLISEGEGGEVFDWDSRTAGKINKKFTRLLELWRVDKYSADEKAELAGLVTDQSMVELFALVKIANSKGFCDFNLDYSRGLEFQRSHLGNLGVINRACLAKARYERESGQLAALCDTLFTSIKSADQSLAGEPLLASQFYRINNVSQISRELQLLKDTPTTSKDAVGLAAAIANCDFSPGILKAFAKERELYGTTMDMIAAGTMDSASVSKYISTTLSYMPPSQTDGTNTPAARPVDLAKLQELESKMDKILTEPLSGDYLQKLKNEYPAEAGEFGKLLVERLKSPEVIAKNKAAANEYCARYSAILNKPPDANTQQELEALRNEIKDLPIEFTSVRRRMFLYQAVPRYIEINHQGMDQAIDSIATGIYKQRYGQEPADINDALRMLEERL